MEKIIKWLSANKKVNVALVAVYAIAILFFHEAFVNLSVWVMRRLTLDVYDKVIMNITFLVMVGFVLLFAYELIHKPIHRALKIFLLVATFWFFVLHLKVLLVVNIELIHALQYGILAVLIFPISWKLSYAMFYATLIGYVDELYQYQWLYPERESYFDFNDIITNQLGMGLFLLLLYTMGVQTSTKLKKQVWWHSKTLIFASTFILMLIALLASSLIVPYQGAALDHTWLVLNEADVPGPFWIEFYESGRYFHVLSPLHGILIHIFLIAFYGLMDFYPNKSNLSRNA